MLLRVSGVAMLFAKNIPLDFSALRGKVNYCDILEIEAFYLRNTPQSGEIRGPRILVSVLFLGRRFAKSICLQDKWPFGERR